jgi:hypothetical protein
VNGIDYTSPLPPSVVARCATTGGPFDTCQGATATGLRLPDEADGSGRGVDQVTDSMRRLSESMDISYAVWSAGRTRAADAAKAQAAAGLVDGGE